MKIRSWRDRLAVGLLLGLLAYPAGCVPGQGFGPPPSAETKLGEIVAIQGPDVTVDGRSARVGMLIRAGEEVRTGDRSEVTIRFRRGPVLHVLENTDPVFEILREPWCLLIRMFYGKAMLDTKNTCVQTETPESVAFVDSVILIEIGRGRTRYDVYRGRIRIAARDNPGRQVPVASLQGAVVTAARVLAPRRLAPPRKRELDRLYEKLVFPMPEWTRRPVKEVLAEAADLGLQWDIKESATLRGKPGTVVRQTPSAGTTISRGDRIRLVVKTAGPPPYTLPDFRGRPVKEVRDELAREKMQWRIEERVVRRHRPGTVLEQEPPPRQTVPRGARVHLVVAIPPSTTLPDFRGHPLAKAQADLKKRGLEWEIETVQTRRYPAGTVVGQRPEPGSEVQAGQHVMLRVAARPAPKGLPRLEGMPVEKAQLYLRELGLTGKTNIVHTGRNKPGTVVRQDPAAGTPVERIKQVLLEVEGPQDLKPPVNLKVY